MLNGSGVATLTLTPAAGTYSLTAVYGATASYNTSASAPPLTVTVNAIATTTALSASPTSLTAGQSLVLTATVSAASGATPIGTVTFFNGSSPLGAGTLNASGVATFSFNPVIGTYSLTATYAGSAVDATSTSSPPVTVRVSAPVATFGPMTFSPAASEPFGTSQIITISDTLTYSGVRPSGLVGPSGAVTYTLNGVSYSTTCNTSGSTATCTATIPAATIAALPVAAYTVAGSFAGDVNYAPAVAPGGVFTITQAMASFGTMTLSPAATVLAGTNQVITISDALNYSGVRPTGAVSFTLNGVSYPASCTTTGSPETCSVAVPAATIAALPVAGYTLTGGFAGDSNYSAVSASSGNFAVVSPPSAVVATPVLTPVAGTYSSAQTVVITDATPGATIYYTTDGTTPTTSSTLYSGPITVAATKTIKAIGAVVAGGAGQTIFSENFDALSAGAARTAAGQFTAINGTNVDIAGPGYYATLCAPPESGSCVDMAGTGGNSVGELQSIPITLAAGTYALSFDLIGSQRGATTTTSISLSPSSGAPLFNTTITLASSDLTSGIVINSPFTVSQPVTVLLNFDLASTSIINIGSLLDNVSITSATTYTPSAVASATYNIVPQATFGTMTFSPAASEPYGASQYITINDTLTYSGVRPTGAVTYVLNGVSYLATCTTAGSPETCSATVPAATIGILPVAVYTVTGSFAGDSTYAGVTAASGIFTITSTASCIAGPPTGNTMNIAYYTVGASDQDAGQSGGGLSTNYVLPGLGANGLPVYNPAATSTLGTLAAPKDVLSDAEITWWSPTLNTGGSHGTSDVVATGTGIVSLPYSNKAFFPPNGTGPNDSNGYQSAILTGTLFAPVAQTVSFTVASDDSAFVYLDGRIACDDGGVHTATAVPCTTSVLSVGNHSIEIFFIDLHATQSELDFTVTTSNISIGSSNNQLVFGPMTISPATVPYGASQTVTIGDTLSYSGVLPTGTVSFVLNGVSYTATCNATASPETCTATVAAATIAALPVGSYTVTASIATDCVYAAATGASGSLTITKSQPLFGTMTFSPAATEPLGTNQAITISDTLSYPGVRPTGAVAYVMNGVSYPASCTTTGSPETCSAVAPAATIAALPVGGYMVTVSFAGDAIYLPTTGASGLFTIGKTQLSFRTMTFSPSATEPRGTSQAITISDTLTYPGAQPTGAVAFVLNGTTYSATCAAAASPATCSAVVPAATIAALNIGGYTVTGSFAGDSNYSPATAASGLFTVTVASTTTTLATSATNLVVGQTLTLTATVTGAGGIVPTGIVTFRNGATVLGTGTLNGSGVATLVLTPAVGTYTITANYPGDSNDGASTSAGVTVTVVPIGTTTMILGASATTLTYGQTLTLTGTAVSTIPSHPPTGTVTFNSGAAQLGSATLNGNGAATYMYVPAVGTYALSATYGGDTFNSGATSNAVSVTVLPAPTTTTLTSNVNPAPGGAAVTFSIAEQSGAGTPSGIVTLMDGTTLLATLALNSSGVATFVTSTLAVGSHTMTASYAGGGNFVGSQASLVQIILAPPTFSITTNGPLTLITEHHGPATITVTPINGFSGNVTLSCGTLPPYARCEWGSDLLTSTTVGVAGSAGSTQLVIETSAVLDYVAQSQRTGSTGSSLALAGLAFPALLLLYRRRIKPVQFVLGVALLLSMLNLSGCAIKYPASTPPGTYNIVIHGSSGTIQQSGLLTLIVTK
jgi:fibro-slime domain-containing protein